MFDCIGCKFKRNCKGQAAYLEKVFFSIGTGPRPSCGDCDTIFYHGIEGVAA